MKNIRLRESLFLFVFSFFCSELRAFEAFEHIWIGETAKLEFPGTDDQYYKDYAYLDFLEIFSQGFDIEKPYPQYLELGEENPYKISFGEILGLAGDYFTLLEGSISSANVHLIEDPELRFRRAFSTFLPSEHKDDQHPEILSSDYIKSYGPYFEAREDGTVKGTENPFNPRENIPYLRTLFVEEFNSVKNLIIDNPFLSSRLEARNSSGQDLQLKEASKKEPNKKVGDISAYSPFSYKNEAWIYNDDIHTSLLKASSIFHSIYDAKWVKKNTYFTELATYNFDHFGQYALEAYKTGHSVALKEALKAHKEKDPKLKRKYLNYAYAMDAFALHFLSDLFSTGHIRTPRKELYNQSNTAITGGAYSKAMHDEDGYYGLKVKNARETDWIAYGDNSYFSDRSGENRYQLRLAVQASVNEVWDMFMEGDSLVINPEHFSALPYLPSLIGDNFPSLFVTKESEIQVRANYANIHDTTYETLGYFNARGVSTFAPHWKDSAYDFRSVINKLNSTDIVNVTLYSIDPKTKAAEGIILANTPAFLVNLENYNFEATNFKVEGGKKYIVFNVFDFKKVARICHVLKVKNPKNNYNFELSYFNAESKVHKVNQINIFDSNGRVSQVNKESLFNLQE